MTQAKAVVDSVSVARNTDWAISYGQDFVERSLRFLADPERKERTSKPECKACYYIKVGRIGGAAMTERPCGVCEVSVMYGSTNTDVLCKNCAVNHQLCKYCGGDLQMRPRRKFDPSEVG